MWMRMGLAVAIGAALAVAATADNPKSSLTMEDMKLLHIYLETASSVTGRLPEKATTLTALKSEKGAANLVRAIEKSELLLNGGANRESVWAYESKAAASGGYVVSNNGVEKLDAKAAKIRLGQ